MILSLFQSLPVPVTEIKPGCRLLGEIHILSCNKNSVAGSIAELEGLLANRNTVQVGLFFIFVYY